MAMLDPAERSARGTQQQATLLGTPTSAPETLLEASWRDYIFAEIWTRPGLDLRSRYFISIGSAASEGDHAATKGYVRGALVNEHASLSELREAALHVAVYSGWSAGTLLDRAITEVARDLDLPLDDWTPVGSGRAS
jgi:4-carboxymuconolactone decarboxylase